MANSISIARRIATVALALAATTGLGTAVASSAHATDSQISVAADTTAAASETDGATTYHFSTRVVNAGEQDKVDECAGGLTYGVAVSEWLGQDYYAIHNECGGAPILDLVDGNSVHIEGLGDFTVVKTVNVVRGDKAETLANLGGEILIQTCHNTGNQMRVVALTAIA